jgi:predicted nucleic acid-binding protein
MCYIAAIARHHNLTIATGNVKDFQRPGIKVFDPFAESQSLGSSEQTNRAI